MENNININPENTEKPASSGKSILKDVLEILESSIITIFLLVLVFTYILHPVNVMGKSMVPTLSDGDKIFMTTISSISNGDIVVINNDKAYHLDEKGKAYSADAGILNECIIKRVIAHGGQTVDIDTTNGNIIVDGKVLDEPYINEITLSADTTFTFPITIPEGYYFVMGDNRNASADSRHRNVGLISEEQIYGEAFFRYSPEFSFI